TIAGPVRVIAFYDVGQVRNRGVPFGLKEPVLQPVLPLLSDPLAGVALTGPGSSPGVFDSIIIGEQNAFKSSTGVEVRFFMPVLNVPFRLIFAMNPSRAGVLDNQLQPQKFFQFRFAVGSTF